MWVLMLRVSCEPAQRRLPAQQTPSGRQGDGRTGCLQGGRGYPHSASPSAAIGLGQLRNRALATFDFIKRFLP